MMLELIHKVVKLVNNSGHKTPTAYPSRRMWLHFKVTDSNNNIVFESGKIDPDGSIAGADNDLDQSQFEPHYNVITSEQLVVFPVTKVIDLTCSFNTLIIMLCIRYKC